MTEPKVLYRIRCRKTDRKLEVTEEWWNERSELVSSLDEIKYHGHFGSFETSTMFDESHALSALRRARECESFARVTLVMFTVRKRKYLSRRWMHENCERVNQALVDAAAEYAKSSNYVTQVALQKASAEYTEFWTNWATSRKP